MENFIQIALLAYSEATDIDKFELLLRRRLMSSEMIPPPRTVEGDGFSGKTFNLTDEITINEEVVNELQNLDLANLSDEEILSIATRVFKGNTT